MKDILESRPEITEEAEKRAPGPGSGLADNELTERIIGAAIEVHRCVGPGLLESAYEECLCYELSHLGLVFQRQVHLPISYKGLHLDCAYRMDLVVEGAIVVEIKAVDAILPIHKAQLLTYLKASHQQVGLLINFNVAVLKTGICRVVNRYTGPALAPTLTSLSSSPRVTPPLRDSAVTGQVNK